MKAKEAYKKIIDGQCNIEAWEYGTENYNAEKFAKSSLNLLRLDDITFNEETGEWFADSAPIDLEFTKNWHQYSGAGFLNIEAWD